MLLLPGAVPPLRTWPGVLTKRDVAAMLAPAYIRLESRTTFL